MGVGVRSRVGGLADMLLNVKGIHLDEALTKHGEHIVDDLRLRVVPVTSASLLWPGPVETLIEVPLAAPNIGMCKQMTMVEFPRPPLDY